jgi:hypothetical protein
MTFLSRQLGREAIGWVEKLRKSRPPQSWWWITAGGSPDASPDGIAALPADEAPLPFPVPQALSERRALVTVGEPR